MSVLNQHSQDIAEENLDKILSEVYVLNSFYIQTEMNSIGMQTDLTINALMNNEKAYKDIVKQSAELRREVVKMKISEETFKNDDQKARYYTGKNLLNSYCNF